MRLILNLDDAAYKRLEILAKVRSKQAQHLAEDLLAQVLNREAEKTREQAEGTAMISDIVASRLLAADPSGQAAKAALVELSMLPSSPELLAMQASLAKVVKGSQAAGTTRLPR